MKSESSTSGLRFVAVWEFQVKLGCEAAFEEMYGPQGDWARLFAQGEGYLGTQLQRDVRQAHRYLTFDFWASQEAYEKFRATHEQGYLQLEPRGEALTERERELGWFVAAG